MKKDRNRKMRRGHVVHPSKVDKHQTWMQVIHKSLSGVSHTKWISVLQA